jgi:hypothetical protein
MIGYKVNLKPNQYYIGERKDGQLNRDMTQMIAKILSGELKFIEPSKQHDCVGVRLTEEQLYQLSKIARENKITVQELLRQGMEQCNLITSTK